MTLSFVVKGINAIKCKLHWNKRAIVFKPSDINIILPLLFNMKWNAGMQLKEGDKSVNEEFLDGIAGFGQNANIDVLIENMADIVRDVSFEDFCKYVC